MIIYNLLQSKEIHKIVDSEIIAKLLLCYYNNVYSNLIKLNEFEINKNNNEVLDYINNSSILTEIDFKGNKELKHPNINFNKHKAIMNIFKNDNFSCVKLENFPIPEISNENVVGPFLYKRYALFYNQLKEILMIFTYSSFNYYKTLLHTETKNDVIIRDLNSYIFDNVPQNVFNEYIINKCDETKSINFKTELTYDNSVSIKIGGNDNQINILKLIKETISTPKTVEIKMPFYKWEIVNKKINSN